MKKLSTQIYLTIIACLLIVVMVAGGFWRHSGGARHAHEAFVVAGELAGAALPAASQSREAQAKALEQYAKRLKIDLALFTADRKRIASFGQDVPLPPLDANKSGFLFRRGGPAWAIALPDGRWLVARTSRHRSVRPGLRFLAFLSAIALIVGLIAWPVVRGLTRRLEQLQQGVEKFGAGDLTARVKVKGRDEVARLSKSFNASAQRIEDLVKSHNLLLANASHELRTPLARIRLGVEMVKENADPSRRAGLETDIKELDALIEEILLLSRLDARHELDTRQDVDLLALAAEEGARFRDCQATGTPVSVEGDPRLLRRMVRNLIDNAVKHGKPPVSVEVEARDGLAVLRVTDTGPGIPIAQKSAVFEPFHRAADHREAHEGSKGTGLGLALVSQIARSHNGQARARPGPDGERLNCLEVTLPLAGPVSARL